MDSEFRPRLCPIPEVDLPPGLPHLALSRLEFSPGSDPCPAETPPLPPEAPPSPAHSIKAPPLQHR